MADTRIDPTFSINDDGTFRVECYGLHYGSASIGDAAGWLVEQLLHMREEQHRGDSRGGEVDRG